MLPRVLRVTTGSSSGAPSETAAGRAAALVVHLRRLDDGPPSSALPGPYGGLRGEQGRRQRRRTQPGQAPAAPPRAPSGSTGCPPARSSSAPAARRDRVVDRARGPSSTAWSGSPDEVAAALALIGFLAATAPSSARSTARSAASTRPARRTRSRRCGPTAACAAAGTPCAGSAAATPGPPAATTRCRPAPDAPTPRHPPRKEPDDRLLPTIGGAIMTPLYYAISAVLVGWHNLWGASSARRRGSPGCSRSSA